MMKRAFFFLLLQSWALFAEEELGLAPLTSQLFQDLKAVEKIDQTIQDQLPVMVNYQLQGGYFTMPSARTYRAGVLGVGGAYVPPYHIWSVGFQFFDHLEATANYWVFSGILDSNFGHLGFGDTADRAANFKWIFLRKEDGIPELPNFALGWNDFLGTKRFRSFYVVATQEFLSCNLEASLGWGTGRIKGFYGGVAWSPLRRCKYFWKDLLLAVEYDANNYRHHGPEHPQGRTVKNRFNAGIQFPLWDLFRFTASTLRGKEWAIGGAFQYNMGSSKGLFPKIYDFPVYTAPVNQEPLGFLRTQEELAQEFAFALKEQGLDLYKLFLIPDEKGKDALWMKIINVRYREEDEARERLERVLAALAPSNISTITTLVEADGVAVYEYRFRLEDLRRFTEGKIGEQEFRVIAPLHEATSLPTSYEATLLYERRKPIWMVTFRPWLRTFLGSSRGKFKYETGFSLGLEGYLLDQIYYSLYGSYTALSSMYNIAASDFLNPSRLLNVRTDAIRYNQASSFHVDQAFAQKSWNWGQGWFSRLAAGYFETAYAGIAGETLYFPISANWAIGFEAATLFKRSYFGVGFQHKVRKVGSNGRVAYFPYLGFQYFVDLYYEYKPFNLDFKVMAGQFLARDKGIRVEGARTFSSGLKFGLWYTLTNAKDRINGSRYYDKGFFLSIPFDFFLNQTSRTRLQYAMSAWLRDCGAIASTGKQLYPTLYLERYNSKPVFY